jgi:hypothetical protein
MVWEYFLGDCYADAIWFPEWPTAGEEHPGVRANQMHPIKAEHVVLCEAKLRLTPELIGQALVYGVLAKSAGANVRSVVAFAEASTPSMRFAAEALGLQVVVHRDA